jgi:hypothetical protein
VTGIREFKLLLSKWVQAVIIRSSYSYTRRIPMFRDEKEIMDGLQVKLDELRRYL